MFISGFLCQKTQLLVRIFLALWICCVSWKWNHLVLFLYARWPQVYRLKMTSIHRIDAFGKRLFWEEL